MIVVFIIWHCFVAFEDANVILAKAKGISKIMTPHPSFSAG